jgi:DNA invertase Pin-like site-specific DNA recombinase
MALIDYARISTADRSLDPQIAELRVAGCERIFEEQISGGSHNRPVLAEAIASLTTGDTLLVLRIDRLARSLNNLLDIIDSIHKRGAFFRSLRDPIDSATPSGKFSLQVLGAAAEFERALVRENCRGNSSSQSQRVQTRQPWDDRARS